MNPATALLQPSRPTTATTTSPSVEPPSSASRLFLQGATSPSLSNSPPFESPSSFAPLPNLLPIFAKYPIGRPNRGTVRIRVEATHFFVHREVLILASPFFESVITGGWKETEPRPPKKAGPAQDGAAEPGAHTRAGTDCAARSSDSPDASREPFEAAQPTADQHPEPTADTDSVASPVLPEDDANRTPRLPTPHIAAPRPPSPPVSEVDAVAPSLTASYISSIVDDDDESDDDDDGVGEEDVVCRLRLVEEKALSFQALLCHLYPRLECLISWNNVGDLCRMASKLDLPSLRNACIAFLLPSAAGKPVEGMRIAEEMNMCVCTCLSATSQHAERFRPQPRVVQRGLEVHA